MKVELINLEIHLPWPPSVNHYYVHAKNGMFISKKGKEYRASVKDYIYEQCGRLKITEQIMVSSILYPPDARTRDIDNYNKCMLDSVSDAKLWIDDSLIDQLFIFRGSVCKYGKVVLFIEDAGIVIPYNNPRIIKSFNMGQE